MIQSFKKVMPKECDSAESLYNSAGAYWYGTFELRTGI